MDSLRMVSATGYYQFKINHSETKNMGIGEWIASPKFRIGQHDWNIRFFPQGSSGPYGGKSASVFLKLHRESVDVRASYGFVMLNKNGHISWSTLKRVSHTFTAIGDDWGFSNFIDIAKLEETYIKDDCFVLSVSVAVDVDDGSCQVPFPPYHFVLPLQQPQQPLAIGNTSSTCSLVFPRKRVQKFREENKQTDVTFDVEGEKFVAHRLILAAHSPVFEAELFGSMAESNLKCITIKEMMPSVFKAMLDFMYNGSLLVNEEVTDGDGPMSSVSFLQNLLVAADRYAVDQLKVLCAHKLAECISLDNVLSLLELTEKYNCCELRKRCLQFVVDKENSFSLMFCEEHIKLMQITPLSWLSSRKWLANEIQFN